VKFAEPLTQELSVTRDNQTYTKTIYKAPIILNGVTDEDYPIYSDDDTYNIGDYVIVDELKTIYRCTKDNTQGLFPPANPDVWVDYGFINSYKMLSTDEQIGSQTEGQDIFMEMEFNRLDTLGLVNVFFIDLLLEQIDLDDYIVEDEDVGTGDGETKTFNLANDKVVSGSEKIYVDGDERTKDDDYTIDYINGVITFNEAPADGASIIADYQKAVIIRKISGRDIGCVDFAGYFYDEIREKTRVIITDLKWLPNSKLKLTFSGDVENHTVKIGTIVIGRLEELGVTIMGTSLKFEDRSKILNDEFTNTRKVIRYGHIRVLEGKVVFNSYDFNIVAQKINRVIGRNILFVPTTNDKFGEMTNIAYIENFDMPVDNNVLVESKTTLIGVV